VTLHAAAANEFRFQQHFAGELQTVLQYSFIRSELNVLQDVVITFAADPVQAAGYEPVFQKIVQTFTFLPLQQRTSFPESEPDSPEVGWTTYFRTADNFSLAVPSDWRQQPNEPHESLHYEKIGQPCPGHCTDLELHVSITPLATNVSLADVTDSVTSELKKLPDSHIASQKADALPAGMAEKYAFLSSDGNLARFHLLWLLVDGGRAYTVHFSWLALQTDKDPTGKWDDLTRQVVWSLRFLKPGE
jgi:hypothetical protein